MSLDASQRRALLRHPLGWIACGFGSGLSPVAPGSTGSLVALLPWFALRELLLPWFVVALVAAFIFGVVACNWAVRTLKVADPGAVVWDEFVGQWIALTPLLFASRNAWWILCGFILFRLFDIAKPWPVSWADRRIPGGLGVMLDDVFAGIYAALALLALLALQRLW
jgi:phosphatidylglycerophosphatase A